MQERTQQEMEPIGASMGYEVINAGFCVTRVNAGGSCIKGEAKLVQHRVPVATRCLVALQHLELEFLVEFSWSRTPQTNDKTAVSPKDPGVFRVKGGTVTSNSKRQISFS